MTRVLGYRTFRSDPERAGVLRSWIMADTVWHRGINVAGCAEGSCSGPPSRHTRATGCGFHGFAHLDRLSLHLRHQRSEEQRMIGKRGLHRADTVSGLICGVVAGSGTVMLCESGWRASRAAIVGLFGESLMAEQMAERYEVPLLPLPVDLARTEAYLSEWGLTHAEALNL